MIMDLRISVITIVKSFVSLFEFIFRPRCRQPGAMCPREFVFCASTLVYSSCMFPIKSTDYLFDAAVFFSGPCQLATSQSLIAFVLES